MVRADHVDDDPADGQPRLAQFLDAVRGLLDGHLLQEGDQVHRRLGGLEHLHDGLRLVVDRAEPRQPRHLVVDVQEPGDPPGRRRVHDHVVVDVLAGPVLAAHRLARLAGQQHVAQARGDGRREVDGAELLERASGGAELVEHLEVVQQRPFGIDGEREDLAPAGCHRDLPLLVGERLGAEELREPLPALDLHEKSPSALAREGKRECRGDRGLAGAALAADHLEPAHIARA